MRCGEGYIRKGFLEEVLESGGTRKGLEPCLEMASPTHTPSFPWASCPGSWLWVCFK